MTRYVLLSALSGDAWTGLAWWLGRPFLDDRIWGA